MSPQRTAANDPERVRGEFGRPLADEIHRQRLIDLLAERWNAPLLQVEAAGGYGKSKALAQAIIDNDSDPSGIDVYVSCKANHRQGNRLAEAIVEELGGRVREDLSEGQPGVNELITAVIDRIGRLSPSPVCLHLDDLHQLGHRSRATDFLAALLPAMPRNAHLVLAGRSLPDVGQLDSHGESVLTITAADLAFTEDELRELAGNHGAEPSSLATIGGWPAMTRLALAVGPDAPREFLLEEVLNTLDDSERLIIGCAVMAGRVDRLLLTAVGIDLDLEDLAARVPLLELLEEGSLRVHDLWAEVLDALVDDEQQTTLASHIAPWHCEAGRYDDAVRCAAAAELWQAARDAVMAAASLGDVALAAGTTKGWLDLFPPQQHGEPELLFLRGLSARLFQGPEYGKTDVAAALAIFDERGRIERSAVVATELGLQGWLTGDVDLVVELMGRAPAEVEAGVPHIGALNRLGYAAGAEMGGDIETAVDLIGDLDVDGLPRPLAELIVRYSTGLFFLSGDSERGLHRVEELLPLERSPRNRFVVMMANFEHGNPEPILSDWSAMRYRTVGNQRDDFWIAACSCLVDGALGLTPDAATAEALSWNRTRERCYVAAARTVAAVLQGDEALAASEMSALVEDLGFDDTVAMVELRRFLLLAYVACEPARDYFERDDVDATLGPLHRRRRALARILVALRRGAAPDWSGYESPGATLCALPLPWSFEFACGLSRHDSALGRELAGYLLESGGSEANRILRRLAANQDGSIADAAQEILASLPAAPKTSTRLLVCGGLAIERGSEAIGEPAGERVTPSKARVRQLLTLLALRTSVSRQEAARLLWPKMDQERAGRNLRVTLSALRSDLEPDRRAGEPTYHLRDSGQSLSLRPSALLTCDVWEIEQHLTRSLSMAGQDRRPESLAAAEHAISAWTGPMFSELDHVLDLQPEIAERRRRLISAAIEVAKAALADGGAREARALARRVVAEDRFNEEARGVIVAAHVDEGELGLAGRAIAELMDMLAELGATPKATTRMLISRFRMRAASAD